MVVRQGRTRVMKAGADKKGCSCRVDTQEKRNREHLVVSKEPHLLRRECVVGTMRQEAKKG